MVHLPDFTGIHTAVNTVTFVPIIYAVLAAITSILSVYRNADSILDELKDDHSGFETFDFIIVGSGSAGGLLANRLSRHFNVLMLEAGGEPNPLQFIAGFSFFFLNYPETDWMYRTVPQKRSCLNSVNQRSSWSAGRSIGGTGMINFQAHLRGHQKDFDNWGNLTGDPSWSYEGVLPFFKSYENYNAIHPKDPRYHGYSGDLNIETPDFKGLGLEFIKAGKELGYPRVDLNAPYREGFDLIPLCNKNGVRQSPVKAFIYPAKHRPTLTIRKFATAHKVLLNEDNRAYGVEYEKHGRIFQVYASKEVIVSAGTMGSPKLLMLSGIGPRDHLQELGIRVRKNLPVGQNLQDHLTVYLGPFFFDHPRKKPISTVVWNRDISLKTFIKYFALGRGVLANSGLTGVAAISSSFAHARGEGDWPDIQLLMFGFSTFKTFGPVLAQGFGANPEELIKYHENTTDKESSYMVISGGRPFSRGYIKLGGASPADMPIIDPKYLEDSGDIDYQVLLEGTLFALNLMENTTIFREFGTRFTNRLLPGCEHLPFRSLLYWECYIRRFSITLHHPCGSVMMGHRRNPNAVVDTELKVIGVQGLRVIDASIMPAVPVTNTQAPTLMIAEKGAYMITREWMNRLSMTDNKNRKI